MKPRRIRAALVALAVVVLLGALSLVVSISSQPPTQKPLPNPNGYDDFLAAAALISKDVGGDVPTMGEDALRGLISTNAEPLRLLRLGLSRECRVPMDRAITNIGGGLDELLAVKRLAYVLVAEGRLRELENRPAEAARDYLDLIRFGSEVSRGGLIIQRLVSIALEALGESSLAKLSPQLTGERTRPIVAELERIDATEVTWSALVAEEYIYARHELHKTRNPVMWVVGRWQARRAQMTTEKWHLRGQARMRLLATELALRDYRGQKGAPPQRLEELVPGQLRRVPLDPFSGQALVYRAQGTNWLLYSVGPDGVDDGGKPMGRGVSGVAAKGDMFYDSPW